MVETLLEVRQLSKTFRYRTGWFHRQTVEAVKPLSFTLRERQTLAIIGENGSGKSTLAKMLAGMVEPTSGELLIDDHPLTFGDYSYRSQKMMLELQEKQGISYIYVTQHLGMMKHISDQVLVMHNGEVVERGSTADVLASPLHDLTRRLIAGHFGEALTADAWRKDGK